MNRIRAIVLCVAALAVVSSCGGNSGSSQQEAVSGKACDTENQTSCGTSGDKDAVLVCVKSGKDAALKWTEQKVCKRSESCEEDKDAGMKCVIDCSSAFLCDERECGEDGCGGSCGGCPEGLECLSGMCLEVVCDPVCGDAQCGPDGCGGECGACAGDTVCSFPDLACVPAPDPCTPVCENRECGPNECGGSCGSCAGTLFCSPADLTCQPPCVPNCDGKDCGDDGCGGSCGGCAGENLFCSPQGTCAPCDPITNTMCPPGQYCTYGQDESGNTAGPLCEVAGTQKYGEPCGGVDSCSEGICVSLGEGEPLCYQICKEHEDCGEGKQCIELQSSPYQVCSTGGASAEKCNLLEQKCTLETEACYFDSGAGEPICIAAGTKQEGESCSGQANDCAKGLTCTSYSQTWTCHKFCNTAKGKEPLCDPEGGFPKCTNYYAKQSAGFCTKE